MQHIRWINYAISSSIIFVWPFTVFLIRNFIPFTLLWHLRFTIEFLWEILFFLIRHTYDSKKELWFGGAQMNMKVMMSEYYCDVDFFISICFICFIIYHSLYIYRLNFMFYAKIWAEFCHRFGACTLFVNECAFKLNWCTSAFVFRRTLSLAAV